MIRRKFRFLARLCALLAGLLTPLGVRAAEITPPLVSFTFDDTYIDPVSRGIVGLLEEAGFRGTFYVVTNRVGAAGGYLNVPMLKALAAAGHEVSPHTKSHADLTTLSATQLKAEIEGSRDFLVFHGIRPQTFAYPLGKWNATVANAVATAGFPVARGTDTALNTQATYVYNLQADSLKASTDNFAHAKGWIDRAIAEKAWLIFIIHKIDRPGDAFSVSSTLLAQIVDYLQQRKVAVKTVSEGVLYYY